MGDWMNSPLHALEDLGPVPYGYVKYRTSFNFNGESRMFISSRADDGKKVFINGKFVTEVSNAEKFTAFLLSAYAHSGSNLMEITYEQFGAPNGNETIGELKGLESVGIGTDFASSKSIESWQIQRRSAIMCGQEINTDWIPVAREPSSQKKIHEDAKSLGPTWTPYPFVAGSDSPSPVPAFTWCRSNFTLPLPDTNWKVPWKLVFDADCDALIYLNEKFVGRYSTLGPQREFCLPEPFLSSTGQNVLMFVLAYTSHPRHLRTVQVEPYPEYTVRRTRLEFEW